MPATASFDSNLLSKLLTAAWASLDSDRDVAKACIQRATELLRVWRKEADGGTPLAPRGGLATWQETRVAAYVEKNIDRNIHVPDLAQIARLSTGHFFRAFRESFGESPRAYVTRRRILRSQALMMSSRAPLAQIALECGMCDQAHFTRVFHRLIGVNPGRWRRRFADEEPDEASDIECHELADVS